MLKSLICHFVLITIFSVLSFSIVHAETYSVFEWAKRSNITNVLLSPDGEKVALLRNDNFIIDRPILEVYDANNLDNRPFRMNSSNTEIIDFYWIADDKIVLTAKLREREKIEGYNEGVYEYLTGVLTLDKNPQKSKLESLNKRAGTRSRPYIESSLPKYPNNILLSVDGQYYNYNVKTGKRRVITREHGGVYSIRFDEDANPRFARGYDAKKNERLFYYREADSKKWEVIHRQHIPDFERWRIQGFDPANPNDLLIIANNGHDKQGLWSFDPKTKKYKELIYRRSDVDVVSTVDHTNRFTNEDTITAIRYFVGREEKFQWFDGEEQAIYEQLKSLVPNSDRLSIRSRSRDGMSMIIRNRGPRDPGTYYLLKNGEFKVIGSTKPGLSSEYLANVEAITYEARDGRKIRGFITTPNSKPPYPLVVMPHGGPFIGENPGFNEWAQMLANRGFMVLQPQYRGSKYFGLDFYKTAFINGGQGGYQMQDDKDDGALYLVEKGLVDPNRMMMFGWSYGGYASLIAAARTPQIYQCVIAGASFPDPIMQVNYYRNRLNRSGGSTAAIEQLNMWLKSMSPLEQAAEVNIPILVVHGDVDQRTPPKAVRKYIKALKKYNKDHKAVWLKGADHFQNSLFFRHKLEFYSEVEKYLKTDCFKNTEELAER